MHGLHSLILLMCKDLHMWWQVSEDKNNFFDCKSYEYTWDTVISCTVSIYCCGIYLKNPKVSRTSGRVCLFVNHVFDMGFTSSGSCGWLWRNRVWSDRKCNVRQTNVRHNGRRSHLRFCLKTGCYSQRSITVLSFIWKCTYNIFLTSFVYLFCI